MPIYGDKQYKPYAPLFPTPADIPLESTCVTMSIPSDPAWIGLWIGVLMELTVAENYQQFSGGISPETTAEIWLNALLDALGNDALTCELAAPYWDDPEADDASSGDTNPDFPFYEDVANFAIAGFVLYATGSPAAALEYWTVSRQFRIQYRKNPLGGLLKIILDGTLIGEVDTYAATPDIGFFDVISPGSTLRLEFPTEGTVTQIIRKRLWEGEITGDTTRYVSDTDTVQIFDPYTQTWIDQPYADPRHNPGCRLPVRGGADPRCDASANVRKKFEDIVNSFLTALAIVDAVMAIGAIISVFAPGFSLLAELLIALVVALETIGETAIILAMTDSAYDQFQCIVYEHMSSDGSITQAQKDAIYAQVESDMSAVQFAVISLIINYLGEVGMSNAGATGTETGGCIDCGWCYAFDFTLNDGEFLTRTGAAEWGGTWYSGQGWVNDPDYSIGICRQIPADCTVEAATFHFDTAGASYAIACCPTRDASSFTWIRTSYTFSGESLACPAGEYLFLFLGGTPGSEGSKNIDFFTVQGTGNRPFGLDDTC